MVGLWFCHFVIVTHVHDANIGNSKEPPVANRLHDRFICFIFISVPYPPSSITITHVKTACMDLVIGVPPKGSYDTLNMTVASIEDGTFFTTEIKRKDHVCGLRAGYTYSVSVESIYNEKKSRSTLSQNIITGNNFIHC